MKTLVTSSKLNGIITALAVALSAVAAAGPFFA